MSCSNCYNGCPQILSDQCVKYTGVDIPALGIKNGDSLSHVEQAIITFLTSTLDGSGIKVSIDQNIICQIVSKYLPTCGDLTVVDFLKALTQAVCELKTLVDGNTADIEDINNFIQSLENNYDLYTCPPSICPTGTCITGVSPNSGTHAILQAVINKLCSYIIDADGTFVKLGDLDVLIAAYLSGTTGANKYYAKMVPYIAVPFFPTVGVLANFSGSGVGSGDWEKIYFCNGQSVGGYQTPDLRGRVPVGLTNGNMGGSALSPVVDPLSNPLNPNYQLGTKTGANYIALSEPQMPRHTHVITNIIDVDVNDLGHSHTINGANASWNGSSPDGKLTDPFNKSGTGVTNSNVTGITVDVDVDSTANLVGGNEAHSNVQPSIGCYYIMYIP